MKRYSYGVLLTLACALLSTLPASAGTAATAGNAADGESPKSGVSKEMAQRLKREYDSLSQALRATAERLGSVSKALAERAEAQGKRRCTRVKYTGWPLLESNDDQVIIEGDDIRLEETRGKNGRTVVRGRNQTITVDGDSVRVSVVRNRDGRRSEELSSFSKRGKRVVVRGDSVLVFNLDEGRAFDVRNARKLDSLEKRLNRIFTEKDLEAIDAFSEGALRYADGVRRYVAAKLEAGERRSAAEAAMKRLGEELERAAKELQRASAREEERRGGKK
ncbi:MAG: hypothetical protein HG464_003260 [Bacteroidia bacterium]|nr:hypothetical protein [Bacteroidia bacterium]